MPTSISGCTTRRAAAGGWAQATLLLTLSLTGCDVGAPHYRPLIPDQDTEIVVHRFRTDSAAGDYGGSTDFGVLFAEYLAGALQEEGIRAVVLPADAIIPVTTKYVVDGDITSVDPGSWVLRTLIGAGTGQATFGARAKVIDLKKNQEACDDTLQDSSVTAEGQESILRRCAAHVANSFAVRIGLLTLSLAGCDIGAPHYRPLIPDRDTEIVVHRFRTDSAAGDYGGSTDFGALFAEYLAGALQEGGIRAVVLPTAATIPITIKYVVDGDISWTWGSFQAMFGARAKVIDLKMNREVYDGTLEDRSPQDWFGLLTTAGQESSLRTCAAGVANSFAVRIGRRLRETNP